MLESVAKGSPPKIDIDSTIQRWVALVLAVCHKTGVSHISLLRHTGRSGKELAEARRLLAWCLIEVASGDEDMAVAWLEEIVAIGRRSITDGLKGDPPAGLVETLELYTSLCQRLGPADVSEAIAAGLLGQRMSRARVWPRGFLEQLGIGSTPGRQEGQGGGSVA